MLVWLIEEISNIPSFAYVIILLLCTIALILTTTPKKYKNIPEIAGYPIFGIVHLLTTITGSVNSHHECLKIFLEKGPISQGNFVGQNLLIINDPKVLKVAFDKIRGKGIFHVSIATLQLLCNEESVFD